jgi:fatty acid desaturase
MISEHPEFQGGNVTTDTVEPERAVSHDIPVALKASLVDDRGVGYRDFRKTLTPRWGVVWRHIACGYLVLVGVLAGLVITTDFSPLGLALSVLGGIAIGYTAQYLSNFFHEAAHHNVAPGQRLNDRITNVLFAWLYWRSIQSYRRIHFQHHRALGTAMDSENSYFDALRVRYFTAGILGLKSLRTMRRWSEVDRQLARRSRQEPELRSRLLFMAVGAGVNLGVAALLWLALDSPLAAAAWLWGVLFVFPFFGSLRQLLEHRSPEADPAMDYREVDHGAVNRLFGGGPVADTLGSAGFNRHALHHWEPNLSYTRLRDLEAYLDRTELAPALENTRTTYWGTFLRLLEL